MAVKMIISRRQRFVRYPHNFIIGADEEPDEMRRRIR